VVWIARQTQAHIILGASAKAGIQNLVYRLSGYNPTAEEVIAAFKLYVQEEAKKYEPEFPNELYEQWHRLYELAVPKRGKPWHFKSLTVRHVYYPLAKSNGKILELLKALKSKDGDRTKKLFQFLNVIGARALRIQLGRVLEMAESSSDKFVYENKIAERFGGQKELELIVPTPSGIPSVTDDNNLLEAATKLAWKPEDEKEAAN
jgi:P63C domain